MTWIIGATTIFGYGALISDVEVSFRNGERRALVQKAFPVSNYIACGFAGSVKIGFSLIDALAKETHIQRPMLENEAWEPKWLANKFASTARDVFLKHPESEKALGAHLLMVGSSPSEQNALGARTYIIRMVSPHFVPGVTGENIKLCSIGSGANSKDLKRRLKPLMRTTSGLLKAEVGRTGGWGEMFSFSVTRILHDNPLPGVSPHHHLVYISRGEIYVSNNNEVIHAPDGGRIEFTMPRVASNYREFTELCHAFGHASAEASC